MVELEYQVHRGFQGSKKGIYFIEYSSTHRNFIGIGLGKLSGQVIKKLAAQNGFNKMGGVAMNPASMALWKRIGAKCVSSVPVASFKHVNNKGEESFPFKNLDFSASFMIADIDKEFI